MSLEKTLNELDQATTNVVSEVLKGIDLKQDEQHFIWQVVMDVVEKSVLAKVLLETEGNQSAVARLVGKNRATVRQKMGRYELKCG